MQYKIEEKLVNFNHFFSIPTKIVNFLPFFGGKTLLKIHLATLYKGFHLQIIIFVSHSILA